MGKTYPSGEGAHIPVRTIRGARRGRHSEMCRGLCTSVTRDVAGRDMDWVYVFSKDCHRIRIVEVTTLMTVPLDVEELEEG